MSANETVLKYLQDQNRPYSSNDIAQNLHKEFGKTAIQKALELLVENEKIVVKQFGKQSVYACARKGKFNKAEFQAHQDKLKAKQGELELLATEGETKYKSLEAQLRELKGAPSNSDAEKQIEQVSSELSELKSHLERLTNNVQLITDKEKQNIKSKEIDTEKEWRKRRRMSLDILDPILENYPKSKKTLYEEIGIETDEDAKVSLPQAH